MWARERVGPKVSAVRHAKIDRRIGQFLHEAVPGQIGFGPVGNDDVSADSVSTMGECDVLPVEHGVASFDELHRWATSSEIEVRVVVEDRKGLSLTLLKQGIGCELGRST